MRKVFTIQTEYVLAAIGTGLGIWSAGYVFFLGLTRVLTDQSAHLNFARLTVDSITPGISQFGFWPPLLHILLVPVVTPYDSLYRSGLAGFVVLLPFLVLGALFLFRTLLFITRHRGVSFMGGLLFLLNPYVLYYAATPMMEVLFLANVAGVAYFFTRWLQEQKLRLLILSALFVTLATISRYEGLILIPLLGGLVALRLWSQKKARNEIEASLVVFLFLASWGFAAILIYGWIYGGSPFSFTGGWWIRDPEEFPTKNNFFLSIKYFLEASFYMLGKPMVFAALGSVAGLVLFFRKNLFQLAPLLILASPACMVLLSLFRGAPPIMVPELEPFGVFFNERYALTWIGFVVVAPLLCAWALFGAIKKLPLPSVLASVVLSFACFAFFGVSAAHSYGVLFQNQFREVRQNLGRDEADVVALTAEFQKEYDYGKILLTRTINDSLAGGMNISLKSFIYEANYKFYDQTMEEPWLFARWVVMYNPERQDPWAETTEPIYVAWGNSDVFDQYYELVFETRTRKVYKVKEPVVEIFAERNGYMLSKIPSINASIVSWDPSAIYQEMQRADTLDSPAITRDNTW